MTIEIVADDADAILEHRARTLAIPIKRSKDDRVVYEVIVVTVGGEKFGLPVSTLREIATAPEMTALPGLPGYFRGMAQIRSELMSVIDLGDFLGVKTTNRPGTLVVVESPEGPIGMLVNGVSGFQAILKDSLAESFEMDTADQTFVCAVTKDLVSILDSRNMVNDPAFVVGA